MEPTFFAQYRGFEFQCAPERLGERTFSPRLVIHDSWDRTSIEIPIDVPPSPYTDPTSAAHRAFALGRRWVDRGFDAASAAAVGEGPPRLER